MEPRALEAGDFARGFLALLAQLTAVGAVGEAQFLERLAEVQADPRHEVYVIEEGGRVVAAGTLLIEPKFARGCGLCGHIEDVVTDAGARGGGLGRRIVEHLTGLARARGCYKVILDCAEDNAGFYAKCGFRRKEVQMVQYF